MEALLSKEHYCFQIHENEKQFLPPSIIGIPHFYWKIFMPPPFNDFSKISPPINRGLHTMNIIYAEVFSGIFCPNYEAVYSKKQLG